MQRSEPFVHLNSGGTSVIIDCSTDAVPVITYWGESLGELSRAQLEAAVTGTLVQRVSGGLDAVGRLSLLPQESAGWQGTPGLTGSRDGAAFSPLFTTTGVRHTENNRTQHHTENHTQHRTQNRTENNHIDNRSQNSLHIEAVDAASALHLFIEVTLHPSGILTQRLTLTNTGDTVYGLDHLCATLPLPASATEILDTTGRHLRERSPQRHSFTFGRHVRESRKGRPGADSTLFLAAGTPGFGFERGVVHSVHLAWSGNHRVAAERTATGASMVQAGELLLPGEVRLAPGEPYETPLVVASWGDGINAMSARFHEYVRALSPRTKTPRPVALNTWEAVYFDHNLENLVALAEAGAAVGAERFVLDDGWFRGRRDDTSALGDWYVDPAVWPAGLHPLTEKVTALGLQFGLWVEPEMVSENSDLARAHPEWILQTGGRLPVEGRQQQVLDLSNPAAYNHIHERLSALLAEYPISYLKWDHNRDLVDAGDSAGKAAVRNNVLALYRLLDELRSQHPLLEIESCASGGARADLGILQHTDRIWVSDCIDPIERLAIQKYTGVVIPNELMGMHVSGPVSHSTQRTSTLATRAAVALFGHFGIEWDIRQVDASALAELRSWVSYHKSHRQLMHSGASVHVDLPDPSIDLRGVVAADKSSAIFVFTQVTTSQSYPPLALHFVGLDDNTNYRVTLQGGPEIGPASGPERGPGQSPLLWAAEPLLTTGRVLRTVGLAAPVLYPEQAVVIELVAA
jgi:alpha-galactosidase